MTKKKTKRLAEVALENKHIYKVKSKPKWFDMWRERHPELALEIEQLVEDWKSDYELQQAYPTPFRLARFIADLPEVDASADVVRKQLFFK